MKVQVLVVLVAVVLMSGCATVVNGTQQKIAISSVPSGAAVSVDNRSLGITPTFAELSRKDAHIVKIVLEGHVPYEIAINRRVSGWVLGNILIGGIPGFAVDAITGGLYRLEPSEIMAELRREEVPVADL